MQELSVFWLRAAVVFYSLSLGHVVALAVARTSRFFRICLGLFSIGVLLHVVAVVEATHATGHIPANNFWETLSLLGLMAAMAFLFVYWKYRFESLSAAIFPLVFAATLTAALGAPLGDGGRLRDAWLLVHVILILLGYSALLVCAAASVVYLVHEWQLKSKTPHGFAKRLPPLVAIDSLMYHAMVWGFGFITLGVIMGSIWAYMESGTAWLMDGRVVISLATWAAYLVMLLLRLSAGWRGRKAAILVLFVIGFSAVTWITHKGLAPVLAQ